MNDRFVPLTPAGSVLMHLARRTEEKAWRALEADTRGMYANRRELQERGYRVGELREKLEDG